MNIFILEVSDHRELGGPMGTEHVSHILSRAFSSAYMAKEWAEQFYWHIPGTHLMWALNTLGEWHVDAYAVGYTIRGSEIDPPFMKMKL